MTYLRELVRTPRPLPSQFGLINKLTLVDEPVSSHWENGFSYEITTGTMYAHTHDVCDYTATGGVTVGNVPGSSLSVQASACYSDYSPIVIEATDGPRSSIGLSAEARKLRAIEACELMTPKAVEREFWANAYANTSQTYGNRSLMNQTPVLPLGSVAVKARYGIAALEQALANEGPGVQGAIHVTRDLLSTLRLDMASIQDEDGIVYTPAGNMLIGGVGYTGNGQTARTNSQVWAYATGPVQVRLSPVVVNEVPSKISGSVGTESYYDTNTLVFTAERFAAATFNGVNVYAVLIDLTL